MPRSNFLDTEMHLYKTWAVSLAPGYASIWKIYVRTLYQHFQDLKESSDSLLTTSRINILTVSCNCYVIILNTCF